MKRSHLLPLSFAAALVLALPAPAQSQEAGDQLRTLIDDLNKILDRGEKERLADPWYLRDLRDLVGRYDFPWRKRLLSDDFSKQGAKPAPPWQVTAGEFVIDWRFGLRSVVEKKPKAQAAPQPQAQQQPQKQASDEEAARQLIGSLLQQAIGGQKQQQPQQQTQTAQQTQQAPAAPEFAAVVAPVKITNAFAIQVDLSTRALPGTTGGRIEFGPYQGANATAGYRLAYRPGAAAGSPSLELMGLSSRGTTSTLELYDQPLNLADGKVHSLLWTRTAAGVMVVTLDGKELLRVTDRSFRDPFDGFAIINNGGDYAFRQVVIDGTG